MKYVRVGFWLLMGLLFVVFARSVTSDSDQLKDTLTNQDVQPVLTKLVRQNRFTERSTINLVHGVKPFTEDGMVRAVIEIPAGSLEKWEVAEDGKTAAWDFEKGKPRIIQYLGYPGNYGFIPRTSLPKEQGGDGDPLDILVLGSIIARGEIIPVKLMGILKFTDNGENDHKLLALHKSSPLFHVADIDELKTKFPGILEIVEIWFRNYKGPGQMEFKGIGGAREAKQILDTAIIAYRN